MPWPLSFLIVALACAAHAFAPARAAAQERRARLFYMRADDAQHCPDTRSLSSAIAARLGYDPFSPDASFELHISVLRTSDRLRARILVHRDGQDAGERVLEGGAQDCRELAESIVLAASIAIDPAVLSRAVPEPAPAPEPTPAPVEGREPAPLRPDVALAPAEAPSAPMMYGGHFGVSGSIGNAPTAVVGFRLGTELRWSQFSLVIEGRADLPGHKSVGGGSVQGSVMAGQLAACGWFGPAFGCGLFAAGAFIGSGENLVDSQTTTRAYVGLGGRIGGELRIYGPLFARAELDIVANLLRTSLIVGADRVWSMFPVSGTLSALLAVHFP